MFTKIATGLIIALSITSSALAATAHRQRQADPRVAYAAVLGSGVTTTHGQHSPNPAWDVYDTSGNYIGSDPDPFIRTEMRRDPYLQ